MDQSPIPRDALPYTDEFGELKTQFVGDTGLDWDDHAFWQALSSIGKVGGVAGKGGRKKAPRTPTLTPEEQLEILRLFPGGIGSRDRLPYTDEFDKKHRLFRRWTGKKLSRHEFWRGLSRVAKLSRKPKPLFDSAPLGRLDHDIVQALERTNPWWSAQPGVESKRFRRWVFAESVRGIESGITPVVAIRGPRQVGKSTIQQQFIEQLLLIDRVPPERILRVQFDDIPGLGSLGLPVESIVRWYEDQVLRETINAVARRGERVYLVFDELQDLHKWSPQLKALVDHTSARTFVTGSSALRIARNQDSLAGRVSTIEMGPLRLHEIAGISKLGNLPLYEPDASLKEWLDTEFWQSLHTHAAKHKTVVARAFDRFSRFGGYPRCHEHARDDPAEFAQDLVEAVVTKTIEHDPVGGRVDIDRGLLRETFRIICRYAGQHVSVREMALQIGGILQRGVTHQKVAEAIQFLADAMLVHQVPPLELLLKKHAHAMKFCICDHFVRNAWLQEEVLLTGKALAEVPDAVVGVAGHIIESVIGYYLMGIPGLEVAWFPQRKTEPEVDFILTIGLRRIPIEIKYKRGRLDADDTKGIRAFCANEHYNAPFGLIITQNENRVIDTGIIAISAPTFLLVQ